MPDILPIILLTIQVSGSALLVAAVFGVPVGILLGMADFPGRRIIQLIIATGMALPPVFVGLLVFMLLSRSGSLGALDWLFTPAAMIAAQSMLAFPIAAGLTASAVRRVPAALTLQIRALGADRWQERLAILREAQSGVYAAIVAAFGRIIAEVGAVILVGGNIAGKTRVLSTAIVLETRQGNFELALSLGLILLGLALLGNALLARLEREA